MKNLEFILAFCTNLNMMVAGEYNCTLAGIWKVMMVAGGHTELLSIWLHAGRDREPSSSFLCEFMGQAPLTLFWNSFLPIKRPNAVDLFQSVRTETPAMIPRKPR
ncbi:hypothetical protein AVEN_74664-1 [Araneus ventricosus]|uniref:Uncharacterized protein n=1 Tax=Araneus ventricosus TaxID=182803 RepID=A0A4Y2V970_ARAVE|nr:hypothetical protein AVEN_74664-1 [Araneus ventricosus]